MLADYSGFLATKRPSLTAWVAWFAPNRILHAVLSVCKRTRAQCFVWNRHAQFEELAWIRETVPPISCWLPCLEERYWVEGSKALRSAWWLEICGRYAPSSWSPNSESYHISVLMTWVWRRNPDHRSEQWTRGLSRQTVILINARRVRKTPRWTSGYRYRKFIG